jgi:hypothetical protein
MTDFASYDVAIEALRSGLVRWFADWPHSDIPTIGSAVYTVWDRDGSFVYVGMSGRSQTAVGRGVWGRLNSHASGRRSGDQFCIYVCDRLVLHGLHNRLSEVATGELSLDQATRSYIRERLGYRFVVVNTPQQAFDLERLMQRGGTGAGMPFLNGLR